MQVLARGEPNVTTLVSMMEEVLRGKLGWGSPVSMLVGPG